MIVATNMTVVTQEKVLKRQRLRGALPLRRHGVTSSRGAGFTYIGLLILISLMGVALAGTGIVQSQQNQRAKEAELLFIGEQFQRAIAAYYERSPGGGKRFPQALDDLLNDTRFPVPQRHLRRIYRDPMTGSTDWGLVQEPDNGISGVFSRSEAAPIKTSFPEKFADFRDSRSYAEWKFAYRVTAAVSQPGENAAQPAPAPSVVK